MLLFLKKVKAKKMKVDRKQLNIFTYKETSDEKSIDSGNGKVIIQVRLKSNEARKAINNVNDYEVLVELLGLDFFKRLGKCSSSEERIKVFNRSEIVKRVEMFQMWFSLELKDRLSLLLLIKEERMYNLLSATITGEIIFGDLVNSIHSLNFLNDSITRQLFDLCLLNS